MAAKFPPNYLPATAAEAQPEPVPALSFTPSPAAVASAHAKGADIAGLLAQLHQQLAETRQIVSTLIWLSPPDDEGLRSLKTLMRKLCLFMGEVDLFAPTTSGGA
jgi:hypothetical protein